MAPFALSSTVQESVDIDMAKPNLRTFGLLPLEHLNTGAHEYID